MYMYVTESNPEVPLSEITFVLHISLLLDVAKQQVCMSALYHTFAGSC